MLPLDVSRFYKLITEVVKKSIFKDSLDFYNVILSFIKTFCKRCVIQVLCEMRRNPLVTLPVHNRLDGRLPALTGA